LTESIELGRVSRAHGLRGEIEIRLYWPESTALLEASHVVLSAPKAAGGGVVEQRVCRVRDARPTPKGVLLSLDEVSDRTAAEQLRGWSVSLEREVLPPLEAGEYYLCDTVGADVLGPDGAHIGRVVDLRLYPSVDAILIQRDDGGHAEQPLVDHWLSEVDVAARKIVLSSTDGMLDVSDEIAGSASAPVGKDVDPDAAAPAEPSATPSGSRRSKKPGRAKRVT
jgi:16S rRNA processing protein RimM